MREMTDDEREDFEANRAELIDRAYREHGITLKVNRDDKIYISNADLGEMVEFCREWRSEIEEML